MRINQTTVLRDFYNENLKTLKKETEDSREWKDFPCLGIGRINIAEIISPRVVYIFNTIPIRIQVAFFTNTEKKHYYG